MEQSSREQAGERLLLCALLAVAGGFLDVYTYLTRGGVFATAETGNIVLLGVSLFRGDLLRAVSCLIPILSFACGVWFAEVLKDRFQSHSALGWQQLTLAVEIAAVVLTAFLPSSLNALANLLVAFTSAMQMESFRRVRGNPFVSTMCTGNLRSGTEQLFLGWRNGDRAARDSALCYYAIIGCFIGGVMFGAVVCRWLDRRASLVCALLLAVCLGIFTLHGNAAAVKQEYNEK